MDDVTQVLDAVERGEPDAAERLLPLVYDELRRRAAQRLAREAPGHTLDATALVHEAYLRLVAGGGRESPGEKRWHDRGHFFAAAAEAMRRILIENARRKKREKHGGGRQRVDLDGVAAAGRDPDELLALDDALAQLAAEDPAAADVAKLCLFAGLSVGEAAAALGLSRAHAYRHWTYARAWLRCALRDDSRPLP